MSQQTQDNLPSKILVVDDDPSVAQGTEESLARYGVRVDKATDLETCLYLFNQQRYDVVLVEIEFAPLPGLALVQKWREHDLEDRRCAAFIMLSGNMSLGANEALVRELGDLEILNKPFSAVQLLPYLARGVVTRKRLLAFYDLKKRVLDYYEKTHDFAKAAAQVEKRVAELGPKGLTLLYDLYEKAGRFEDALSLVNPMLEKEPNSIALLNAKGRLLMRMGRFAEAKDILQKSDELAPQNIERLNELATAYLHLKDPDGGVGKFKDIIKLSPEKPDLKFEMFSKLYEFGYDDHAINLGKETTKPMEIVRHFNNKGVMLSKDGDTKGAIGEYGRALKFFPKFKENYRIHYNIALAKLQTKTQASYQEACKHLKTCIELAPSFEKARKRLELVEKALAGMENNKNDEKAAG